MTVGVGEPPLPAPVFERSFHILAAGPRRPGPSGTTVASAVTNIQQKEVCVWSEWHYYELDNDEVRREPLAT